jgi:hypothetical protein
MTTQMVRKQIYIQKRQEAMLKGLSKALGLSEAEIIRRAIERELGGNTSQPAPRSTEALDQFIRTALKRRVEDVPREPYQWNRQELYEERESRWLRDSDQE